MREAFHFPESGLFRLMQLTDTHFMGDPETDGRTDALLRQLIAAEKPDFILHTGDAVYGPDSEGQLDAALRPLTDSGIPWSFVFGNHDGEYAGNKQALLRHLQGMPGCRAWHDEGSGDGVGNAYFRLEDGEGRLQWLFVCLDSGGDLKDKAIGGYQYVTPAQITWYRRLIRACGQRAPDFSALVFQHIPLPEFREVWKYEPCFGMNREGTGCPRINSGFFCAMLEEGHARGLFAGHDHMNDFWGSLYGVALGYGRMSGYGSYGAQDYPRGCRMFEFRLDTPSSFRTYVRLEGNTVVDAPWASHPLETRENG